MPPTPNCNTRTVPVVYRPFLFNTISNISISLLVVFHGKIVIMLPLCIEPDKKTFASKSRFRFLKYLNNGFGSNIFKGFRFQNLFFSLWFQPQNEVSTSEIFLSLDTSITVVHRDILDLNTQKPGKPVERVLGSSSIVRYKILEG